MSSFPKNSSMASAPEHHVVALAMTGDDWAFEEIVRRRQGVIRRLMYRLSGDWSMADDYAQESFLLAWRKLKSLRSSGAFGGWLRTIAVNVFLQHARRTGFGKENPVEMESYEEIDRKNPSVRMDLDRALAHLRPVERLCVVLSHAERMSHGEICTATGLPLGTVKSHVSRGTKRLRQYLKDYEVDVS